MISFVGIVSHVVEELVKIGESGVLHYGHGSFRVNEVIWFVVVLGKRNLAVNFFWVYPTLLFLVLVSLLSFCTFLTFVALRLFTALGD